ALPDGLPAKAALQAFEKDAAGDLAVFRARVEQWFDDAMSRVSGWYRRRVQLWLVVYAALVCVALNVDTFAIARSLWTNGPVRQAVVAAAGQERGAGLDGVASGVARVRALDLPITWAGSGTPTSDPRRLPRSAGGWAQKVAGLALSMLALSLGAPFWFDLLGKVTQLRLTGPRPGGEGEAR
ncbi:MAG TPA: hypothetical protein VEP73_02015, partial [Actinomycetota bacterium]|nr:hypothetical protein [Actinomycetota bacterium]